MKVEIVFLLAVIGQRLRGIFLPTMSRLWVNTARNSVFTQARS